ncbi:MAG: AraC family transcriptional regulator [Pseudomonadota bacterium]
MLDLVTDVLFWVKDDRGCFVHGNRAFLEHQGAASVQELVGKTDFDFSPRYLAAQYAKDDQSVLQGASVTNRLEMNTTESGDIAWFSTSKRPVRTADGDIVGSYGMTRHFGRHAMVSAEIEAVRAPVEFVRANFARDITVADIALAAHLSVSALERRFKKHLNKTPRRFLIDTRLEQARRLLVESEAPIAEIAFAAGFSDHSYFSQQFRKFCGVLPSEFRRAATFAAGAS